MSRVYRSWRPEEVAILAAVAPAGLSALRRQLPGRTRRGIKHKARLEGIKIPPLPIGNRAGTRWRGKLAIPAHAHPFVRRIYTEANRQYATIAEIADRAGVERHLISSWPNRNQPKLADIVAVLNVLGLDLVITEKKET